jgi:hypothetical protein
LKKAGFFRSTQKLIFAELTTYAPNTHPHEISKGLAFLHFLLYVRVAVVIVDIEVKVASRPFADAFKSVSHQKGI